MNHQELFDLTQTDHAELFTGVNNAWEALLKLQQYVAEHSTGQTAETDIHPTAVIDDTVTIGAGTMVGPNVVIKGPAIIGQNCEIRPGAFLRGNVLIGDNCVVGNSTEMKHCWLFNNVQVPHYNYVGDSILGYKAHFGGGASTANKKGDGSEISVLVDGEKVATGMTKLGALVGDNAELGGNSLLNPGTIIGRNSTVYPGAIVRGTVPSNSIVKMRQTQEVIEKR